MKRCALFFPLLLVSLACGPAVRVIPPHVTAVAIDFRGLSGGGFYISPDPYPGEHVPLGLIYVLAQAGGELVDANGEKPYTHWVVGEMSVDSAVAAAKAKAISLGGDGLANLRIEVEERELSGGAYTTVRAEGWRVSALAIRRGRPQ